MRQLFGFVPRVTSRNRRGVARALRPPSLIDTGLSIPWAVLDAPSGLADPTLPADLRDAGVEIIVDTGAWRFGSPLTFDSPKWSSLPYTPDGPFELTSKWISRYVERDLQVQAQLGSSVYLVPGWFPAVREEESDTAKRIDLVFDAVDRAIGTSVDVRPMLAFVAIRRANVDLGLTQLARLNGAYEGVYVQMTPVTPYSDPVDRMSRMASLLAAAGADGRQVIAGHLGAISNSLTALGVGAADAGLGDAESFNLSSKLANQKPPTPEKKGGHPQGPSIYVPELGRSVNGKLWRLLQSIPSIRAELECRRSCCRFRTVESMPQRAVEHALQCRIEESEALGELPSSMRIDHVDRALARIETRINVINGALDAEELPRLSVQFVHAQRSLLAQYYSRSGAA